MKIRKTEIYKLSIPMHPFTIATGTMHHAQNTFIRIHVDEGYYGCGECSAFPVITGESQATCYEMAKDFAMIWKGKNADQIEERMSELHDHTAFNSTIKSAFDMALFDLAAKKAGIPLYLFLDGKKKLMETDLTIGIETPEKMAEIAVSYKNNGVQIIKIKLGKDGKEDIERVKQIRESVGDEIILRIDANQGWTFDEAGDALYEMGKFNIQFCEQPLRHWDDGRLSLLKKSSPIPIMADESVFNHHDAIRLIEAKACDYVNIKFAKSGGILEAKKINAVCEARGIPCMMGGMLESRMALTAFAHFALASRNIIFYDMDTCMLGHKEDPVQGGVKFKGYFIETPDSPGIGADVEDLFLKYLEQISI
jgi:L-alanine-DL-glutamate epimerase-like enolase superfamily enzyme